MNKPDDGGHGAWIPSPTNDLRARMAMEFAAAWLPIVDADGAGNELRRSGDLGIAMADYVIRRLKETE